jgi:hypothetical protein
MAAMLLTMAATMGAILEAMTVVAVTGDGSQSGRSLGHAQVVVRGMFLVITIITMDGARRKNAFTQPPHHRHPLICFCSSHV